MKHSSLHSSIPALLVAHLTLLGAPALAKDETVILDPIVLDGTPAESLKFDPVVPAYSGKTEGRISTGNIGKELANDLPFHSNANQRPGNEVGFSGIGKGPEETDVNILGIPVNRPQGGGADLATFPQYFWNGYNYQIGPSLGAFDPRGVGGSLSLRLWTQDTLGTESSRATAFHSTRKVQQFSYGKSSKRYSVLAGMTTDLVVGPALSLSAIPFETAKTKITTHLIFTDTNAKEFASERSGATNAEQHTYRLIPVVQVDRKFSESTKLKTSFFYDLSYVRYEDPSNAAAKQIKKVDQVGNETALLVKNTRIGFGIRHVHYKRSIANARGDFPSEQVVNLQATQTFKHAFENGNFFLLEPTLGGYLVTRKGFYPTGTIGARHEFHSSDNGKFGQFARVGFTKRFPSLLDRYYEFRHVMPSPPMTMIGLANPDLKPENVRSTEFGADYEKGALKGQLTGFLRDYKHARYTSSSFSPPGTMYFKMQNAGDAYVFGATASQDWSALPFLDLGARVTYQKSKIEDLKAEFPYSPRWVGILKFDLHTEDGRFGLQAIGKKSSKFFAYSETSGRPQKLPTYHYVDLFARAQVFGKTTLILGVENLFDRPIQYRLGSPDEGRVFSLAANANF